MVDFWSLHFFNQIIKFHVYCVDNSFTIKKIQNTTCILQSTYYIDCSRKVKCWISIYHLAVLLFNSYWIWRFRGEYLYLYKIVNTRSRKTSKDFCASQVVYNPTKDMISDFLTKLLQGSAFRSHQSAIMGLLEDADERYEREYKDIKSNSWI